MSDTVIIPDTDEVTAAITTMAVAYSDLYQLQIMDIGQQQLDLKNQELCVLPDGTIQRQGDITDETPPPPIYAGARGRQHSIYAAFGLRRGRVNG